MKYMMNAGRASAAKNYLLAAVIESVLLTSAWLLSGLSDTLQ